VLILAKQANVRTLRLETGAYQPAAIHLYQQLGYYPIPPFDDYKEDPLCLFFEKTLI
jgi:putative acetyltransferase